MTETFPVKEKKMITCWTITKICTQNKILRAESECVPKGTSRGRHTASQITQSPVSSPPLDLIAVIHPVLFHHTIRMDKTCQKTYAGNWPVPIPFLLTDNLSRKEIPSENTQRNAAIRLIDKTPVAMWVQCANVMQTPGRMQSLDIGLHSRMTLKAQINIRY